MTIRRSIQLLIILFLPVWISCNEIVETNLTKQKIQLNSPMENYAYTTSNVSFWWNKVNGVVKYRLQVVKGSFDSTIFLVTDTLLISNRFNYSLAPGKYNWRVRGENNSTYTPYSSRFLEIDSSQFTTGKVVISSPVNASFFGQKILFRWAYYPNSSSYLLEVDTTTGSFSNPLFQFTVPNSSTSDITSYQNISRTSGSYKWRVNALSNIAESSQFSDQGTFLIHNQAPVLSSPASQAALPIPVHLAWNEVSGSQGYNLLVRVNDQVAVNFPKQLTSASYDFSEGVATDTVYWKVSATDASGNVSDTSVERYFIIN